MAIPAWPCAAGFPDGPRTRLGWTARSCSSPAQRRGSASPPPAASPSSAPPSRRWRAGDERADDVVREVRADVPEANVHPWACDVSSLTELRRFAARFAETETRLDVLVNNAGVMPYQRERST